MQENKQERSPIKQKILLYLTQKGVSAYEFYKNSGVTRGVLSQNNGITEENISRFLAYAPDVNAEWLLRGKGDMLRQDFSILQEKSEKTLDPGENSPSEPKITTEIGQGVPYFDVDFFGGFSEIFNNQTAIPACNIVVPGFDKATVWCNVTGHSMEPKINHGDIIALRECTVQDIQYGEIYAVVLDTIRTIKILRRGSTPDVLLYAPINKPDYQDQEFPISRILTVFEVIGSIAKFF
ncbi:MAG: LexA family transcriptional regulator [Prevotella sp.]|nr:LexA family transcriptional regulator [Prevotella sp.]